MMNKERSKEHFATPLDGITFDGVLSVVDEITITCGYRLYLQIKAKSFLRSIHSNGVNRSRGCWSMRKTVHRNFCNLCKAVDSAYSKSWKFDILPRKQKREMIAKILINCIRLECHYCRCMDEWFLWCKM